MQKKLLNKYIIIYSNQHKYKMETIFMNSENSENSYPNRLLLNLTDKI